MIQEINLFPCPYSRCFNFTDFGLRQDYSLCFCRCGTLLWQHWRHDWIPSRSLYQVLLEVLHPSYMHREFYHDENDILHPSQALIHSFFLNRVPLLSRSLNTPLWSTIMSMCTRGGAMSLDGFLHSPLWSASPFGWCIRLVHPMGQLKRWELVYCISLHSRF